MVVRAPDLLIRFALQPIASIAGLSLLLAASPSARAGEIKAARGGQDLGTLINGGTRCRSGSCKISGGTRAGKNVFHRFSQFDTRGEITGVSIDNSGSQSVFLGVTSPQGSFLDKKLQLKQPGNLYWLSPGGLQMQNGAAFGGVLNLYLSTATGIAFQDRRFDLMNTSADQAERLTTDPLPGRSMFQTDPQSLRALALNRNGDIQISGGLLTIDRSLLIDAQLGDLLITDSAIQGDGATLTARARQTTVQRSVLDVSSADRAGGVISLTSTQGQTLVEQSQLLASGITGGAIDIFGGTVGLGGSSMLQADGFSDAGSIRIGGDYLGKNPDVLNAATTEIGPEVLVSANSLSEGNGGRIIVWSDGLTTVNGRLEAKGGVASGNGGFIETSGKLGVNIGEHLPDVSAPNGVAGSWLLDPNNVVIANLDASAVDLAACAFSCVFEDPSGTTTTLVNPTQIADRLGGSAGAGSISITADGSITVSDPINISPGTGVGNTFTLDAGTDLFVNQPIDSGGAALDFSAGRLGSGNVLLAGSGGLDSGGANIQLKNLRADSLNDGSIDAGTGTLTLAGNTVVSGQPVTYRAGNFNLTGPVSINNVRLTLEGVGSALPGVAIGSTLNLNGSGSELHLHRDPALSLDRKSTRLNSSHSSVSRMPSSA